MWCQPLSTGCAGLLEHSTNPGEWHEAPFSSGQCHMNHSNWQRIVDTDGRPVCRLDSVPTGYSNNQVHPTLTITITGPMNLKPSRAGEWWVQLVIESCRKIDSDLISGIVSLICQALLPFLISHKRLVGIVIERNLSIESFKFQKESD